MVERSDLWTLHLVSQLSQVPQGFDEDVLRSVRAIAGVTSVAVVPSSDASTHRAFSTRYSQVVAAANEAKQGLQAALDAHHATVGWWQRNVRLLDESAVRKVAELPLARLSQRSSYAAPPCGVFPCVCRAFGMHDSLD
jgi:hypothetical protein